MNKSFKLLFFIIFIAIILSACTTEKPKNSLNLNEKYNVESFQRNTVKTNQRGLKEFNSCGTGYIVSKINGKCITLDQFCVEQVGPSTYKTIPGGGAYCECNSGYIWNAQIFKCVSNSNSTDTGCNCAYNLYNCDDFYNTSEAQKCYEYCKSIGKGDIHHLDSDNDGLACETQTESHTAPSRSYNNTTPSTPSNSYCCKYCSTGKACGDSCIAKNLTCHKSSGCACNK